MNSILVDSSAAGVPGLEGRLGAPKAVVYNRYLRTVGGGERSCIEFARALEEAGYEVTLVTDPGSNTSIAKLTSVFGISPRSTWSLVELPPEDLPRFCRETGQTVFVNHTYSSYIESAARVGLYLLMFPHQLSGEQIKAMRSYKKIFCISPFVELYLKLRWGDDLPIVVLPPPISEEHFSVSGVAKKKEKLILNLGRFNIDGHSKRQKEAIEAFLKLKQDGVLDAEWRMVVAGHLNEGEENRAYFELCQGLDPAQVTVVKNISFHELQELYSRAAVLFQFTGVGLDSGLIPERCEHLGLVAMDALCYGTIPVVYERSGAALLTDWGDSMYSFADAGELAEVMGWINREFGSVAHANHMRRCQAEAKKYSCATFYSKFAEILAQ